MTNMTPTDVVILRRRISTMERRDGMDQEAFEAHWSGPHVPIVTALPGIRIYIQHRLLGSRPPGVDGISEVVFEAPQQLPSDRHFSREQSEDELAFVSAVTGMPVEATTHDIAPFVVWVLARDSDGAWGREVAPLIDHVALTSAVHVRVDVRDESLPVMTRPALRTDPSPPRIIVQAGFVHEAAAREARADLAAEFPDPNVKTAVTRTQQML